MNFVIEFHRKNGNFPLSLSLSYVTEALSLMEHFNKNVKIIQHFSIERKTIFYIFYLADYDISDLDN